MKNLRNADLESGRVSGSKKPSAGRHSLSHAIAEWAKPRRAIEVVPIQNS
jgi:hypothetical protein